MQDNRNDHQVLNQKQALDLLFETLMKARKDKKQVTKGFILKMMQPSIRSKKEKREDTR